MKSSLVLNEVLEEIKLVEDLIEVSPNDLILKRIMIRILFSGIESLISDLTSNLGKGTSRKIMNDFNHTSLKERVYFVLNELAKSSGSQLDPRKFKEWNNFLAAIKIRNRITHPKSTNDLNISDVDYDTVRKGLLFVLWCVHANANHVN